MDILKMRHHQLELNLPDTSFGMWENENPRNLSV